MEASFKDLLNVSEDLAPSNPTNESAVVHLDFHCSLNLRIQTNVVECGGQIWPGGMVLAEYLINSRLDHLKGRCLYALTPFCVPVWFDFDKRKIAE